MADPKRVKKYDTDLVSFMLFLLTFCIIAVVFTFKDGSDVMFYAGFPMLFSAAASAFSLICVEEFTADQTQRRLSRKKYGDAVKVFFCVTRFSGICAAAGAVLFLAGAGILGGVLIGNSLMVPVLRMYAPALIALPLMGTMKGFLRGSGSQRLSRILLWLFTALFFVLGLVGGLLGAHRGSRVEALLRNEDMGAVYCACGIGIGFSAAALICAVILAAVSFFSVRRLQRSSRYRQEELFERQGGENPRELFSYCLERLLPGLVPAIVLSMSVMISYRMWMGAENERAAVQESLWGGFFGVGLPVCTGLGLLLAMPFTHPVMMAVRAKMQGKRKNMRFWLLLALRLSGYVGIPASAFVFGAAKELAGIFTNLTFKAEEAAVLTLKSGSFLIFLLQTTILVLVFYWKCGSRRIVMLAAGGAFFAGVVTLVLLRAGGVGITMNVWPLAVMGAVFLAGLYFLGKSSIIQGVDGSFMTEYILIAVCAAGAVIPLELLNDYLLMLLPPAAGFLLMLAVFWILYVLLSLFLHAADLRNLHRIPGGGWIRSLAVVLGVTGRED